MTADTLLNQLHKSTVMTPSYAEVPWRDGGYTLESVTQKYSDDAELRRGNSDYPEFTYN